MPSSDGRQSADNIRSSGEMLKSSQSGIAGSISQKPMDLRQNENSYIPEGNSDHINRSSSRDSLVKGKSESPRIMFEEDSIGPHQAVPPRPLSDMAIKKPALREDDHVPLLSPASRVPIVRNRTSSAGNIFTDPYHIKRLSLESRKLMGSPSPHEHHSFYQTLYHTPSQHFHGLPFENFEALNAQGMGDAAAASIERLENLQEMRSQYLIGQSGPLRDWSSYIKSDEELAAIKNSKTRKYYENQNELLERYIAIDTMLDSGLSLSMLREYGDDHADVLAGSQGDGARTPRGRANITVRQGAPANLDEASPLLGGESKDERSNTVMFAIYVNFVINFLLLVGKIAVALLTNSLSIVASLVDSALDFLSTFIIWVSTRLVDQRDWKTKHLYPVGRSRLEPIGVLVFSIVIIVSFLKIADEAIQQLWRGWMYHEGRNIVNLGLSAIIIMIITIITKVFCWVWCRSIDSSAVQALAQDAMTDIIFNFFSLLFPLLEHYTKEWWLDPLGALFLSCYIIYSWGCTAIEHINNLTGSAADPSDRQVVLYLGFRFAECIKYVTALNTYHAGDRITVEIDIILSESLKLKDSHDIAESLQYAIETLPFVERAFVHLDYRTGNFAGHLVR